MSHAVRQMRYLSKLTATTVVFAVGDALGDPLVRPGRVVVHLVFSQDGAQVGLAEYQHAIEELSAQGPDQALADGAHPRSLDNVRTILVPLAWKRRRTRQ
jgi:hypothetical protein